MVHYYIFIFLSASASICTSGKLIIFFMICNRQAIDKELEQKEGYESFSVPQQQQSVPNAWQPPMIQQQQHPGKLNTVSLVQIQL